MRWFAIAGSAVLVGTILGGLFEPLTQGRDDSWAIIVTLLGAMLGLGAGTRSWWALAVAPPVVLLGFGVAFGFDGLYLLAVLFGAPLICAGVLVGVFLGRAFPGPSAMLASFGVALLPVAWAAHDTIQRQTAAVESPAVQRAMLSGACADVDLLLREVERHPGWLVTYTYVLEDPYELDRERITVREVAEETIASYECSRSVRQRLRDAL